MTPHPSSRLARTALVLGIALETVALLKLLPTGVLVALGLVLLTLVAFLLWHPPVTLAVVGGLALLALARRRTAP